MPPSHISSIAVVGAGAIGCYYGARLATQVPVHFLMRRDLAAVRARGLMIHSVAGDLHLHPVSAAGDPGEIGAVDLVLISVKATQNEDLLELLPPLLHEGTILLTLQNGLGNEPFLAKYFPDRPILGGICFVCIHRGEPGIVHHTAHGLVEMGELTDFGCLGKVAALFEASGIPCKTHPDLGLARWRKLVWNVPFNGLSIVTGGYDTRRILDDPDLVARSRRLMEEVIRTAAAYGHDIEQSFIEANFKRTSEMGPYHPTSWLDFAAGNPVEVEAIWGEPLRQAGTAGLDTPELALLFREICESLRLRPQ
jgi:2-dehydropantoate 2-reductase